MSHVCFGEDALTCDPFYLEFFLFIEQERGEWWSDNLTTTTLPIVYRCWPCIAKRNKSNEPIFFDTDQLCPKTGKTIEIDSSMSISLRLIM